MAHSHSETVKIEVERLCSYFLPRLGEVQSDGRFGCTFGKLFVDEEGQQYFEAILGTLKAAKKQNLIDFKGQMLLKGAHDNVVIYLLEGNKANSTEVTTTTESADSSQPTSTVTDTSAPVTTTKTETSPSQSSSQCTQSESDIEIPPASTSSTDTCTSGISDSARTNTSQKEETIISSEESEKCNVIAVDKVDPCAGNLHVFESLMKEANIADTNTTTSSSSLESKDSTTGAGGVVYTLSELKSPGPYPSDVNINSREQYLSPTEFLDLFKMNINDFKASPKWKQDSMKKKHNLF